MKFFRGIEGSFQTIRLSEFQISDIALTSVHSSFQTICLSEGGSPELPKKKNRERKPRTVVNGGVISALSFERD
jgi:hypothetical protein